jgi:hypothetical protein
VSSVTKPKPKSSAPAPKKNLTLELETSTEKEKKEKPVEKEEPVEKDEDFDRDEFSEPMTKEELEKESSNSVANLERLSEELDNEKDTMQKTLSSS